MNTVCRVHLSCHSEKSSDDLLQPDMPRSRAGIGRDMHSTEARHRPCFRGSRLERRKYEVFAGDKVTMKEAS